MDIGVGVVGCEPGWDGELLAPGLFPGATIGTLFCFLERLAPGEGLLLPFLLPFVFLVLPGPSGVARLLVVLELEDVPPVLLALPALFCRLLDGARLFGGTGCDGGGRPRGGTDR